MRCVEVWLVELIVHPYVLELRGVVDGGSIRSLRSLLFWALVINMLHLDVEELARV